MSELKTLEDMKKSILNVISTNDLQSNIAINTFIVEELKAEAVKELKIIDNSMSDLSDLTLAHELRLYDLCKTHEEIENCLFGIRRFLIWKFNISEEDLK